MSDGVNQRLDEAVQKGALSRERADSIKEKVNGALDNIIDSGLPFPFEPEFHFKFRDRDGWPPDGSTPVPQGGSSGREQQS
jgi:hypothetical protein